MLKLGLILQNIHFIVKTQAERQIIKLSFRKQKLVYVVDPPIKTIVIGKIFRAQNTLQHN